MNHVREQPGEQAVAAVREQIRAEQVKGFHLQWEEHHVNGVRTPASLLRWERDFLCPAVPVPELSLALV